MFPLAGISIVLPICAWAGLRLFASGTAFEWSYFPHGFFMAAFCVVPGLTVWIIDTFLNHGHSQGIHQGKLRRAPLLVGGVSLLSALIGLLLPTLTAAPTEAGTIVIFLTSGQTLIALHLLVTLYALFLLENTYRYAYDYQRRTGRLGFISLLVIILINLYIGARILLFRSIDLTLLNLLVVSYSCAIPLLLFGFLRYRLGYDKIEVIKNAVYSSFSLLFVGAIFVGIGLTALVFRVFHLTLTYFQMFALLFAFLFIVVVAVSSQNVRFRFAKLINRRLYPLKYDYRNLFFKLNRSFLDIDSLGVSLTEVIENLRLSKVTRDAFVFVFSTHDNRLQLHQNIEQESPAGISLSSHSPLTTHFRESIVPLNIGPHSRDPALRLIDKDELAAFKMLGIDVIFPLLRRDELMGLLCLRRDTSRTLDIEDRSLIEVYAALLGDVIFKHRMLQERLERKQFETFMHVSSFIVHDIKNQVSTLSLLVQNAQKNITNPKFQESLLSSLSSCTQNMQSLIGKLQSPPRHSDMRLVTASVNEVVQKVIINSGFTALTNIRTQVHLDALAPVVFDEQSLFYIIKNVITNAIEAMNSHGSLSITTADCSKLPETILQQLTAHSDAISRYRICLAIEDSGQGMPASFIKERLFHPFATTKDRGVGIGLYQCKVLIEKMGGAIMCISSPGIGTTFYIFL